jgi:hypothetical protein
VSPSISHSNGTSARAEYQPLRHKCRAWREGRMSDHLDHVAEYARSRAAGRVCDEFMFAALAVEATLDREEASA